MENGLAHIWNIWDLSVVQVTHKSNVKWKDDGHVMIFSFKVDEIVLEDNKISTMKWIKSQLSKRIDEKHPTEARQGLVLEISWARLERKMWLNPSKYVTTILNRLQMVQRGLQAYERH